MLQKINMKTQPKLAVYVKQRGLEYIMQVNEPTLEAAYLQFKLQYDKSDDDDALG